MTAGQHAAGQPPAEPFLYRRTGPVSLHLGDARQVLAAMPDASVDCLVTSPPFWGLRDYGSGAWHGGDPECRHRVGRARPTPGTRCRGCGAEFDDLQYGLEDTVEQYVARLVTVFDEARRVLVPSGTCWLNLGDSYSAGTRTGDPGLAAKNLHGVPWRVAFALQSSGWLLRNAVVWAKSNPMPESVRDRLSTTYELLFLLTRSRSYYFDLDPIRIPLQHPEARDGTRIIGGSHKGRTGGVGATARRRGSSAYGGGKYGSDDVTVEPRAGRGNLVPLGHAHTAGHPKGRNPGDVWRIATRPYRGSHVAPFPIDLPLRAIAAGCPPGGVVCDPFSGAGTTGLAALQLGRGYIGVDIVAGFHDEALTRLRPHLPGDDRAGGVRLRTVPVTFAQAREFIGDWHRHHRPPRGHKYSIGAADERDVLVGVAVVGRPVARLLDDGLTLEVTRLASDGSPNVCSLLYAAAWQAAKALGYRTLITYTQQGESGASLRAAGWRIVATRPAAPGWSRPSRPRHDHGTAHITRSRWQAP